MRNVTGKRKVPCFILPSSLHSTCSNDLPKNLGYNISWDMALRARKSPAGLPSIVIEILLLAKFSWQLP